VTYDDVADIKAMLGAITALLERMADTLDHIDDNIADIHNPMPPMTREEFRAEIERIAHIVKRTP
jgi:hypothetical protein